MQRVEPSTEQLAMVENIGETLDVAPVRGREQSAGTSRGKAPARKTTAEAGGADGARRR